MSWQDLLKRPVKKVAKVSSGPTPLVTVEAAEPPGFGPRGQLAERPPEPVEQPLTVRMKEQVMGGAGR